MKKENKYPFLIKTRETSAKNMLESDLAFHKKQFEKSVLYYENLLKK